MRAGISLIEIVLAIVILAVAAVPLVGLFSDSSAQSRQSKDYGQLAALEEKVCEEVRQAAWEDPHFHKRFDNDSSYGLEVPIVDAQSPFFPALEDARAPFGTIGREDPGISKDYTPALFEALREFRLELVSSHRRLIGAGEAFDLALDFRWTDFRAQLMKRRQIVTTPLFAPRIPEDEDEVPRDTADERVRALMFPTATGRSLADVASSQSANLEDLRVLGDAAVALSRFVTLRAAIKKKAEDLAALVETRPAGMERLRTRMAAGRSFEALTAATLDCIGTLRAPLEAVRRRPVAALQRLPNAAREVGAQALRETMTLPLTLRIATANALFCYVKAYQGPDTGLLSPRQANRLFAKVLDLAKLDFLVMGSADGLARIKAMLDGAEKVHEGRNRNLAHFVRVERELCRTEATLKAGFSLARRAADWDAFNELSGPISVTSVQLR